MAEVQIIRRFECTKCDYVHVFSPKDKSKFPKKVQGFTCPHCGHRPTEAERAKIKGRGPKPKGERRKRVKKEPVMGTTPIVVHPYVDQFDWHTSGPPPPGGPRMNAVRAGWQPKPPQPTTRTLEDAVVEAFLSSPKRGQKK